MLPDQSIHTARRAIPLTIKISYTAFVVIHGWVNWCAYGPLNFLWVCDIAVLTTLVALWLESSLLLSVAAMATLLPMGLWMIDLAARILLHHYVFGFAGYMFDRHVPKNVRIISGFHIWLPLLLIWGLKRLGYDRRAFVIQSCLIVILLPICRLISAPPPTHQLHEAVNINWVYGPSDNAAQTFMPGFLYVATMMMLYPLCIYLPTHLVLRRLFAKPVSTQATAEHSLSPAPLN